jgi:hypothetical protein
MPRSNEETNGAARWLSDTKLCVHLDIGRTTLHRMRNDPALGFPKPAKINGLNRTSLDQVDPWMLARQSDDAS